MQASPADDLSLHEAIRKKWFHGRSWWHAYAQLNPLGVAFFRTFQLRAFPLRTLSLGVLIVCGGTLAALPFRRYHSIQDASAEPSQVTGPSQTELQSTQFDPSRASNAERFPSLVQSQFEDRFAGYADSYAVASSPATKRQRQLDIPLTYEDLATPIDPPAAIEQRFSATVGVREKQAAQREQMQREHADALLMPGLETLSLQQREHLESLPDPVAVDQAEENRAGGRY